MNKKLYVGSLSYGIRDNQLRDIFAAHGEVVSAKVITEPGGRSKGFGFVEMSSEAEANDCIQKLNGTQQDGRAILVSLARPETKRTGGGFGGNRGGFGGSRNDDRGGNRGGSRW